MEADQIQKHATLTVWVNEFSDDLFSYAMSRLKQRETSMDLVQETFLAAWKNITRYNGEASVRTWLFTILKNKLIDHYRKEAGRMVISHEDPFFDEADHWDKPFYPRQWVSHEPGPVETKEFYRILRSCQSKLKTIQNIVFSLKYIDGLDSEEICHQLQLTSANYWVLVHRAKLQLRACLEKNWYLKNQ